MNLIKKQFKCSKTGNKEVHNKKGERETGKKDPECKTHTTTRDSKTNKKGVRKKKDKKSDLLRLTGQQFKPLRKQWTSLQNNTWRSFKG